MSLPDAAASAAYWRSEADRLRILNAELCAERDAERDSFEFLVARVEMLDNAIAESQVVLDDMRNLSARAEAALRDRATLEENYTIAKAHHVELRQLVDAERHRAQRFNALFGACLNWKEFRRASQPQRAASDAILLRAIDSLSAEVPH